MARTQLHRLQSRELAVLVVVQPTLQQRQGVVEDSCPCVFAVLMPCNLAHCSRTDWRLIVGLADAVFSSSLNDDFFCPDDMPHADPPAHTRERGPRPRIHSTTTHTHTLWKEL